MLGSSSQVKIRKGRQGDANALAEVFRGSWTQAYRGIIPHLHLESLIRRRTPDWWSASMKAGENLLVLDVADSIAGYATSGAARVKSRQRGEIYELYLSPVHQGLGFGEYLFEACRSDLDRRRLNGLVVWALSSNTGATDFYWRRGGRPFARTFERFGRDRLEKIGFAWD